MQRIISGAPIDQATLASYEQSLTVLCRHFPPLITSLYASARRNSDGNVEWWSEREGQPIPLSALPGAEQAALLQKCQQRQESIAQLAEELARRGEPLLAKRLQTLLSQTPQLVCYGINGEPVLIQWGIPETSLTPLPLIEPPPPPRRWYWVMVPHLGCLAAILLALLLGLLLLFYWSTLFPPASPVLPAAPVVVPVSAPVPTPIPTPVAAPVPTLPVSDLPTELTKAKPSVSLPKQPDFGRIRVNLNWVKPTDSQSIDLDIGAFVRLKDQQKGAVEALSRLFGDYNKLPYVELKGDDRTGNNADGEWLFINGSQWPLIDEVLLYAFIYKGAPNWQHTHATITIDIPGQPAITTRLTDEGDDREVAVIARLINVDGTIKVERINRYFDERESMSKALNWGLKWSPTKGKG
ncbi:MAG: hypothetical protein ACRC9M_06320 [Aeromonas sp.]